MTTTYETLLLEVVPSRIEDHVQYDVVRRQFGDLLAKRRRTIAEGKLMRLLGVLIEDYDRRNALPAADSSPGDSLRFLMEHSVMGPSDLLDIFGKRSHVNEALNGKRKISAEQARKLGQLFSVKPGLFI